MVVVIFVAHQPVAELRKLTEFSKMIARALLGHILSVLIAGSAVARATPLPESAYDTGGIRLGMTHSQAREAILQLGSSTVIGEARAQAPGSPSFVYALRVNFEDKKTNAGMTDTYNEQMTVLFSPVPGEDKVLGIYREVRFRGMVEPNQPTLEGLVSGFISKYGIRPWHVSENKTDLSWYYDQNGNTESYKPPHPCADSGSTQVSGIVKAAGPNWAGSVINQQNSCGISVHVMISISGNNKNLADYFIVQMSDQHDVVRAFTMADKMGREAVEQQQKSQIDRAQRGPAVRY